MPRLVSLFTLFVVPAAVAVCSAADPSAVDPARLARIDEAVKAALDHNDLTGCVILVLHRDRVVYRKAFGNRAVLPQAEEMTSDTVFDLASLTKPIATAASIMILVERGKLNLSDRVAKHWPAFGANGKDKITVEQLLLHTSGLVADNDVIDYANGREKALERIAQLPPASDPGAKFVYSDVGYIVLGELVERISGKPLDEFTAANIYKPLGMKETTFRPTRDLRDRAAPTQKRDDRWLRGEVHDPRAHALGGVAGHAGLFSTADDLAIYARMLLHHGTLNNKRILSPQTVRLMTTPREVPRGLRAYGWDVQTAYSANKGERFPRNEGFGHTGFTGTSIWIDPSSDTAVIFLSNRVHPDGKGNVTQLRGQVATLAAAAILDADSSPPHDPATAPPCPALTGTDPPRIEESVHLRGCRVSLFRMRIWLARRGHRFCSD
jgi:CubicO group peptidase (beta-lactamase class C family)